MGALNCLATNGMFQIDEEDLGLLKGYHWNFAAGDTKRRYVLGTHRETHKMVYLHRLVARAGPGQWVDHRDGDTANCTRSNLRIATASQNQANSGRRCHKQSSRYKGVFATGTAGKFKAMLCNRHLGVFASEEEAAAAYDHAAQKKWGDFARLNFPIPDPAKEAA